MAEDWLADVRRYVPDADEGVVGAIVRYCGIALQNRDSSLVSFGDVKETDRVRENYLKKKLGLTHSDDVLNSGIAAVGERMKDTTFRNRVTVYYLLAEHFGLLNIFGGAAGTASAAPLAAAAGLGAAATGAAAGAAEGVGAAGMAAAGLGAAAVGATAAAAAPEPAPVMAAAAPEPAPAAEPAYAAANYGGDDDSGGGGLGWLKWLLLAALLAALLFFLLRSCSGQEATPAGDAVKTEATGGETADTAAPAATPETETATPDAAADPAAAAPVPTGSGVVAGERNGKPMLTVYFDQAKTNIPTDFDKVAAVIKDYAAKNPGAKFAVSGFNSPTGSAAGNARLSKGRAENVGAALQKLGVPAGTIELVKPEQATQGQGEDAQARRVEVTVK